jgi:cytochrome oxidase Cu insertion factor (SCO1/SenC/PrrC family)
MNDSVTVPAAAGHKRSLWPLWTMVAVFGAPVLAAWFYFFFPQYLPQARSNRGEFLDPPVALPDGLALTTPGGEAFDPASLNGAWTLVYLAGGVCDQVCVQNLVEIRQLRLGLGENRQLVERLLLIGDPSAPVDESLMQGAFEGMHVVQTDLGGQTALLGALASDPGGLNRVYILDPVGRLMMRYAADAPPKDKLKDMERLLKGSKNWIKGANYVYD